VPGDATQGARGDGGSAAALFHRPRT
jgi:hypothetical protein